MNELSLSTDQKMMLRCIQLAKKGFGATHPNPMVGSVITYQNKIIGEGWHQKAGLPHAEINAIQSVKNKNILESATLYVNLEPCVHFGKTPPCTNAIIENRIPKVVIGHTDHSSKVNGKGIEKLRANGVEVIENCLKEETYDINKRFFTYYQKNRPYIILKWAETNNGFMGVQDKQVWLTNDYAKQWVHKWRTEEDAILVGKNTVLIDNPQLTSREYYGKNPIRIVIDKNLSLSKKLNLLDNQIKTIIFNQKETRVDKNTHYIAVDFKSQHGIPSIMEHLYQQEIQSLIIEGGKLTLDNFIAYNLWDEARIFVAQNKIIEKGIKAPQLNNSKLISSKEIDNNILYTYINRNKALKL